MAAKSLWNVKGLSVALMNHNNPRRKEEIMKTKAAIVYEYKKPMVVDEIELEGPREKEVLVQFKAAGLCHTDLSIINGVIRMPPPPCIPGHEGTGIVQEVGPGVTRVKPGDHVILMWVPICGECYYCLRGQPYLCVNRDKGRSGVMLDGTCRLKKGNQYIRKMVGIGSFSEYNVVNEESVLPIDPDIPFDVASIVGCAVITGVGAVLNTAKVKQGSSVAIVGVGGVGLNVVQGSVLANATKIIAIDILDNKLAFAKQLGATHVINASKEDPVEKVKEITGGIGVDYAFEALGRSETVLTTFKLIRRGGRAVIVGISDMDDKLTLPVYEIPLLEKSILGCYYGSANVKVELITLLDLYKTGRLKLDQLITNRYSLEQINKGFEDMESGKNARGVIIY